MLELMGFEELKGHAEKEKRASMHYGGKIRRGILTYIEQYNMFYLKTPEGRIEICDREKIQIGKKKYIVDLSDQHSLEEI